MNTLTPPGRGDACPVCQPGIPDAAQPHAVESADGGNTLTTHTCMSCDTSWRTLWGRDGWPIDRLIAPVSPEQAARNRDVLERAVKPVRVRSGSPA